MSNNFINHDEHGRQVKFVDERFYQLSEGVFLPGITTILSIINKGKQFENWLKSNGFNADVLAKKAMDQGSNVHAGIQSFLQGSEVLYAIDDHAQYSQKEWIMISRFMDFFTAFKPETVAVEIVLASEKLGYGSQLDYICKLNGERWYIDHKSGTYYPDANMQLAAGVQLWNEKFPQDPITRAGILHLESLHRGRDKKGISIQGKGWKLIPCEDIEAEFEDFKHAQALWKRKNKVCKPFFIDIP